MDCIRLSAIPAIYGLADPDDGVDSWVFALSKGQALIVPGEGKTTGLVHTDLEQIIIWWAPIWGADLVLITA